MLKKIMTCLFLFCICVGVNLNVYAKDDQEELQKKVIAIENEEVSGENRSEKETVSIPQNGLDVYMENTETPIKKARMRTASQNSQVKNERYTVLVLDNSASTNFSCDGEVFYTADTALPDVKMASRKFVENIDNAPGDNYVAIVSYRNDTSMVVSQFTTDTGKLEAAIDSMYADGYSRSVYNGLTAADELIDSIENQQAIKNVVLFSTGMTSDGIYNYEGHYDSSTIGSDWQVAGTGVKLYAYANKAYEAAEKLKEKCTVYSIGLFNIMDDMPEEGEDIVQFFKLCACDWASDEEHFYDVKEPNDLKFVFGEIADNIVKRTGLFLYPGDDRDHIGTYYYDDNYFRKSSYIYNQNLATMSLCLELSAWNSESEPNYDNKMKNAKDLLGKLGFDGFYHNYNEFCEDGITGKPTKDSIGVVAAHKKVKFKEGDYTLIAVAVRGGGYEKEWASNATVGKREEHDGFSQARDQVLSFMRDYIKGSGISGKIKIWITGYSRAAAVANMVAGAIDEAPSTFSDCELELKDLFAYTFETPAGVLKLNARQQKFSNIFNIINREDPVPFVAPKAWGFHRYGVDRYLPSYETDGSSFMAKKSAMLEKYKRLPGYTDYYIDDFKMKKLFYNPIKRMFYTKDDNKNKKPQGIFLDEFITEVAKTSIGSRTDYVDDYQEHMRSICNIFFGQGDKTDKLFEALKDNMVKTVLTLVNPFTKEKPLETISKYLEGCLDEAGITNDSKESLSTTAFQVLNLLVSVSINNPNKVITVASNLPGIGQAHFPELCLAWMQSMDTNYTTDAGLSFSSGRYRIIRINCPVDVSVYDEAGKLLTSIINDVPQADGDVLAAFDENDEKLVYLPVDNNYVVKLACTGNGVMNYAVQEYDPQAGQINHFVNFNDIQIAQGQVYTAYLPRYKEEEIQDQTGKAAGTNYTLYLDQTQVLPDIELKGEDAFNAYYHVGTTTDDAAKGIVFGAGVRQLGTFAKVTATPYNGYEFVGWYEKGNLIATEQEYKFRVDKDTELAAVFKEISKDDRITGSFKMTSQWNDGFNGEITLQNMTNEVIHNWRVEFDLPYEITNIWNGAIIAHDRDRYTVRNAKYNSAINPGESVTFGFTAHTEEEIEVVIQPTYYTLKSNSDSTVTEKFDVSYQMNASWGTACNGSIELRNVSSEDVFDWTLEFDYDNDINQLWNAEIVSHIGNHYVIRNKGYNAEIGAGQTIVLAFEAGLDPTGQVRNPQNYKIISVDME